MNNEKICAVILNFNDAMNTLKLANDISYYKQIEFVIVIDNSSTDNSWDIFKANNNNKILFFKSDKNGGYGYGNNYGIRKAFEISSCDKVLLCNPDVVFSEEYLTKIIYVMNTENNCGIVSSQQLDKNGKEFSWPAWSIPNSLEFSLSLGYLSSKIFNKYYIKMKEQQNELIKVDCVAGSLLLMSREAFEKSGGYDENIFLYCEETVLGIKMRNAGINTVFCKNLYYTHYHGVSISKSIGSKIKQRKILIKSHEYIQKYYLSANILELCVHYLISYISIIEEFLYNTLKRVLECE